MKREILLGYNGFFNRVDAPDLSLPEAIKVDKQNLDLFSGAEPESRPSFPRAGSLERQAPFIPFVAAGQNDKARFLEEMEKCAVGLEELQARRAGLDKTIARYRELGRPGQLKLAEALQQLGALYREEGDKQKAMQHYEESLSTLRLMPFSETNTLVAGVLKELGSLHCEMQQLPAALLYFEEALNITRQHSTPLSDPAKLEAAAIASLAAAIRMNIPIQKQAGTNGRSASQLLALAEQFLAGLNEEGHLVKKRLEELKYLKRVMEGLLPACQAA